MGNTNINEILLLSSVVNDYILELSIWLGSIRLCDMVQRQRCSVLLSSHMLM